MSQFGPINLLLFTILVLSVSFFLQKQQTLVHVSFKINDQGFDLKSTQVYNELPTYDHFYISWFS